jgi:hypothetical protein
MSILTTRSKWAPTVTIPEDGDAHLQELYHSPHQSLIDRSGHLYARRRAVYSAGTGTTPYNGGAKTAVETIAVNGYSTTAKLVVAPGFANEGDWVTLIVHCVIDTLTAGGYSFAAIIDYVRSFSKQGYVAQANFAYYDVGGATDTHTINKAISFRVDTSGQLNGYDFRVRNVQSVGSFRICQPWFMKLITWRVS